MLLIILIKNISILAFQGFHTVVQRFLQLSIAGRWESQMNEDKLYCFPSATPQRLESLLIYAFFQKFYSPYDNKKVLALFYFFFQSKIGGKELILYFNHQSKFRFGRVSEWVSDVAFQGRIVSANFVSKSNLAVLTNDVSTTFQVKHTTCYVIE